MNIKSHRFLTAHMIVRIIIFVACFIFSLQIVVISGSVLPDYLNGLIHEAGHMLFVNFGEYWYVAGGTLLQLCVPTLTLLYCALQRKSFATAVCGFWLGENLVEISRYIADAETTTLQLTGTHHDWKWLLEQSSLLPYASVCSWIVYIIGLTGIFAGLTIMYTYLILRYQKIHAET